MEEARALLLLWGFMGTGKTTVGRALAARAGVAFVDLDEAIEREAHMTIAEIFAAHGEPFFRALEKEALEALLDGGQRGVVALGGGTLLDDELRARALAEAFVVSLTAPLEMLQARIQQSARPLSKHAARLWKERAPAYAAAHRTLDTSGGDVGALVEELLNTWRGWRG